MASGDYATAVRSRCRPAEKRKNAGEVALLHRQPGWRQQIWRFANRPYATRKRRDSATEWRFCSVFRNSIGPRSVSRFQGYIVAAAMVFAREQTTHNHV